MLFFSPGRGHHGPPVHVDVCVLKVSVGKVQRQGPILFCVNHTDLDSEPGECVSVRHADGSGCIVTPIIVSHSFDTIFIVVNPKITWVALVAILRKLGHS